MSAVSTPRLASQFSPVEFQEKIGLMEKITIKQIYSLPCTEFSVEYENNSCKVVSFGGKKL